PVELFLRYGPEKRAPDESQCPVSIIGSGVVLFPKESYHKKKFHSASPWSDFEGLRPGAPGRMDHSQIDRTGLIPQNQTSCTEPNGYALEERVPHRCKPRS
ncbi:MAG: hypothetical protein JSW56_03345, partial [Deltaproteobacteria bacterium]